MRWIKVYAHTDSLVIELLEPTSPLEFRVVAAEEHTKNEIRSNPAALGMAIYRLSQQL